MLYVWVFFFLTTILKIKKETQDEGRAGGTKM